MEENGFSQCDYYYEPAKNVAMIIHRLIDHLTVHNGVHVINHKLRMGLYAIGERVERIKTLFHNIVSRLLQKNNASDMLNIAIDHVTKFVTYKQRDD